MRKTATSGAGATLASVACAVATECQEKHRYDQLFIFSQILDAVGAQSHSDFWKKINDGVAAGEDPRDRCACGKLATSWSNTGPARCSDCCNAAWVDEGWRDGR